MGELVNFNYFKQTEYANALENVVGATTNTTLRTVTTHNNSNTEYVSRFGNDLQVTAITSVDGNFNDTQLIGSIIYFYSKESNRLLGTLVVTSLTNLNYTQGDTLEVPEGIYIKTSGSDDGFNAGDYIDIYYQLSASETNYVTGDFDTPDDSLQMAKQYSRTFGLTATFLGFYEYIKVFCGDNEWVYNDFDTSSYLTGQNAGSTAGAVKLTTNAMGNWTYFDNSVQNGLRTISFPKTSNQDLLGGTMLMYFHDTAFNTAFSGNQSDILITNDGSVFKGSISIANLVVDSNGNIGVAGGGSSDVRVYLPREYASVGGSSPFTYYPDTLGRTFYNSEMSQIAYQQTPDGTAEKPYRSIQDAHDNLSGKTIITVLDNGIYVEKLAISTANVTLQSALGFTPTVRYGIGVDKYYETSVDYAFTTAVYWNENGSDSTGNGTRFRPYATLSHAITNRGSKTYIVYGGEGATGIVGSIGDTESMPAISTADLTLETENGFAPVVNIKYIFDENNSNKTTIRGFDFRGGIEGLIYADLEFNSFKNAGFETVSADYAINYNNVDLLIERCFFESVIAHGVGVNRRFVSGPTNDFTDVFEIKNCGFSGTGNVAVYFASYPPLASSTRTFNMYNSFIYNCFGEYLVLYSIRDNSTIDVDNNVLYGNVGTVTNQVGMRFEYEQNTPSTGTFTKNIYQDLYIGFNTSTITSSTFTLTDNLFNNVNTQTAGAGITNNSPVTADPELIVNDDYHGIMLTPNNTYRSYGIQENIFTLTATGLSVNGFIFDMIYITDFFTYTVTETCSIEYCTLYRSWSYAFLIFKSSTMTKSIAYRSRMGVYRDGTDVDDDYTDFENNVVHNCFDFGLYVDTYSFSVKNSTFYNNDYNLYLQNAIQNNSKILNNIFQNGATYDVYSNSSSFILINCMYNSAISNVIFTTNCIIGEALFVSLIEDSEDFNIKTVQGGFSIDSLAKDAGTDGNDIGAYDIDRSIDDIYYKQYTLPFNPRTLAIETEAKKVRRFTDARGEVQIYSRVHRRILPFIWADDSAVGTYDTDGAFRKTIDYFSTLHISGENGIIDENEIFRISLLPDNKIATGTSAIISSTAKTITDSSGTYTENELKGWHVNVLYESLTGDITASSKEVEDSSKSWVVNQWAGYWILISDVYYYIKSNTADTLTLSDPYGNLSDDTSVALNIHKSHKIESNTATVLTLKDDDSELVSGDFDYEVDFIECKLSMQNFRYRQSLFDFSKEYSKSGFKIEFEEAN